MNPDDEGVTGQRVEEPIQRPPRGKVEEPKCRRTAIDPSLTGFRCESQPEEFIHERPQEYPTHAKSEESPDVRDSVEPSFVGFI